MIDGATVEMIDAQPEHHLHDVFVVIVDERLTTDGGSPVKELHQALGAVDDRVPLAQFQESPWPATILRRHVASAASAGGVATPRLKRTDLLDADVVLPAVSKVILVEETLTETQPKVGQSNLLGIVAKADATEMTDAVLTTVNDEAIEMLIAPTQCDLQDDVEIGDSLVATDEQATPDQWADTA